MGQIYVQIRFQTLAFPRGKKSGLTHIVAQGGGENGDYFAEEW